MKTQLERWKLTSLYHDLERIKNIFEEPRVGTDLVPIMEEFRSTIEETSNGPIDGITGALFFAVFRGKIAEGIDFSDNEARCVLTVSIL